MTRAQLVAHLSHLRAQAANMVAHVDVLIESLPPERPAPQEETADCAAGRHPVSALIAAPVMGKPDRKVCRACRQAVE